MIMPANANPAKPARPGLQTLEILFNAKWKPQRMTMTDTRSLASPAAHILIVEDDRDIANMLVELVTEAGFEASAVASGSKMDQLLSRQKVDLILLDAMLPGEDGFSICRRLRNAGATPILMLTALGEEIDRILGLELGADDYVTKPFNSRELMARIRSLLRRSAMSAQSQDAQRAMTFAGWRIDPESRQLQDPEGLEVSMTTAEFDILLAFCSNQGRVLTRKQLLALTHAGAAGPVQRSIDVHVSRVRQKIEPNLREPSLIKTVRLGGYLFTPKVEQA
jgi:two-component system OmpR family response regulator